MSFNFDFRSSDSPYVEWIWRTQTEKSVAASFMSSAESHWEMVFTKQQGKTTLSIRGPETQATPAPIPEDAEFFGIVFRLGVFMPHLPTVDRVNSALHLPESTRRKVWLHSASWEIPDFENADTFIEKLVRYGMLASDPLVDAVLQDQAPDVSPRTVRRRFLQATGLTPKTIQQIQRAKQAAELLKQGTPILDAVYELGYFDQPHMTKSLKYFIGQTPAQIAQVAVPDQVSASAPTRSE